MPDRNDEHTYSSSTDARFANSLEYAAGESLTSVIFDDHVTHISAYAFYGNGSLHTAKLPTELTSLGWASFYRTGIEALTLPAGVTEIPGWCFAGCANLTELVIPNTVMDIGEKAFADCASVQKVTLPIEQDRTGVFNGCTAVTEIHYTAQSDGVMPDRNDEHTYSSSTDARFGNSLEYAARDALRKITLDEGVTHIGAYAFYGTRMLSSIRIPASVRSVGARAFAESGLEEVSFAGDAPVFDGQVFPGREINVRYNSNHSGWDPDLMAGLGEGICL